MPEISNAIAVIVTAITIAAVAAVLVHRVMIAERKDKERRMRPARWTLSESDINEIEKKYRHHRQNNDISALALLAAECFPELIEAARRGSNVVTLPQIGKAGA